MLTFVAGIRELSLAQCGDEVIVVKGEAVEFGARSLLSGGEFRGVNFSPELFYEYEVDGEVFSGSDARFNFVSFGERKDAISWLKEEFADGVLLCVDKQDFSVSKVANDKGSKVKMLLVVVGSGLTFVCTLLAIVICSPRSRRPVS